MNILKRLKKYKTIQDFYSKEEIKTLKEIGLYKDIKKCIDNLKIKIIEKEI